MKKYVEKVNLRIINHFDNVICNQVLLDQVKTSRFLCFGGGVSNVKVEIARDTY